MKTDADLRTYCESRFPVGEPTNHMRSVTGEEYVEVWRRNPAPVKTNSPDEALKVGRDDFDAYADGKSGVLYWRVPPVLEKWEDGWGLYMRCLISDKPPQPELYRLPREVAHGR